MYFSLFDDVITSEKKKKAKPEPKAEQKPEPSSVPAYPQLYSNWLYVLIYPLLPCPPAYSLLLFQTRLHLFQIHPAQRCDQRSVTEESGLGAEGRISKSECLAHILDSLSRVLLACKYQTIRKHLKCVCVVSRCYCPYRWQIKVQVLGCLAH